MRIGIESPSDASAGLILWDLRKRAVDDQESKARQERLKEYVKEAERKKEQSKKEEAKTTKQ